MRTPCLLCLLAAIACSESDPAPAGVAADEVPVTLRLAVSATGRDVDSSFTVGVQEGIDGLTRDLRVGVAEEFEVTPGPHTISLRGVESNCRLLEGQPYAVQVASGAVTDAALHVSCDGHAFILATATPDSLLGPQSAARCRFVDCGTSLFSEGRALLRTTAGHRVVSLPCALEIPVETVAGDTVRVGFNMFCDERPK